MGPIDSPETSVNNYQSTLRNVQEERKSHLDSGGSLKSRIINFFFSLDAGLLARSQYSEGPATGHLDTGFSWFLGALKQMLRWFPRFQVATTCFSCSPPDLNSLVTNFMFCTHVK